MTEPRTAAGQLLWGRNEPATLSAILAIEAEAAALDVEAVKEILYQYEDHLMRGTCDLDDHADTYARLIAERKP